MIAVLTGLLGLTGVGWGPVNGDQAVYLHQAATGAWFVRWVHVGYVLVLGLVGGSLGADVLNVGLGCIGIVLIGLRTGVTGALLTAGCVLPWLPFGEVDVPWFAAVAECRATCGNRANDCLLRRAWKQARRKALSSMICQPRCAVPVISSSGQSSLKTIFIATIR